MRNNNLVEKLSLQVESFQEGFEILCKSFSFEEMVKSFLHLMRGNFIISEILAYHKKQDASEWNVIASKRIPDPVDLSFFKDTANFSIQYYDKQKFDASIILPLSDKSFLGILIGPKMDKSGFADFDKITLQILLQVFDSAHKVFLNQKKEKALIFELNEKVAQLNNLIDTVIEISRYDKRNILFELTLERMASLTNASSALIQIGSKNQITQHYSFPPNIDKNEILNSKFKLESSFDYNGTSYFFTLAEKETRTGVTNFNDLDKLLLDAITKQVQASIENEYLLKQSLEKQRIEQEINVAASIQQRIIPKELPKIEGFEVSGINIPSSEVGGDYYDFSNRDDGSINIAIGDVTGHGMKAGTLVTMMKSFFIANSSSKDIDDFFTSSNAAIKNSNLKRMMAGFAMLNIKNHTARFINAAMPPLYHYRKKEEKIVGIKHHSLPLGAMAIEKYKSIEFNLNKGDVLIMMSDGFPELRCLSDELFGYERVYSSIEKVAEKSPDEIISHFKSEAGSWSDKKEPDDDITFVVIKIK